MSDRAAALALLSRQQYGVFARPQALGVGYSSQAISRRLMSGDWVSPHVGVYACATTPLTPMSRVMAAVLACGEGFASHRTAAALHRLDGFWLSGSLEVMVFHRRGLEIPGLVVHRPCVWLDDDRAIIDGIPVTDIRRTLFDLAVVVRDRRLAVAFDDAIRRGMTTLPELAARLEVVAHRGVPGVRRIARLLDERSASDPTDSELETEFRELLDAAGLPTPVGQYVIRRPDGTFVAEVDFSYPNARIAIELDSWGWHGSRDSFHADRIRQNELVVLGWSPLRFTKADIRSRRRWVASTVRQHLETSLSAARDG